MPYNWAANPTKHKEEYKDYIGLKWVNTPEVIKAPIIPKPPVEYTIELLNVKDIMKNLKKIVEAGYKPNYIVIRERFVYTIRRRLFIKYFYLY